MQHRHTLVDELVQMEQDAFSRFVRYSGPGYNQEDSTVLEAFEAVLEIIPIAKIGLKGFRALSGASTGLKLFQRLSEIAETAEKIKGGAGKLAKIASPKAESAQERAVFEIQTINSLGSFKLDLDAALEEQQDLLLRQLDSLKDVPNVNLQHEVDTLLGWPLADRGEERKAIREAGLNFEFKLYKAYYAKTAYYLIHVNPSWGDFPQGLQGVPPKVQERILELGRQFGLTEADIWKDAPTVRQVLPAARQF
jgi:hypothetical protein